MLVLSREQDQVIRIGEDIQITVVRIADGKVRLGITAPRGIPVHREEVYQDIQRIKGFEAERDAMLERHGILPTEPGRGCLPAGKGARR